MDSFLIPLFSIVLILMFYPALTVYVALIAGVGVFMWLIMALMLSPFVGVAYYVDKKRMFNSLKVLLDNKPRVWDIEKVLVEYEALIKKEHRHRV